MQFTTDIEKALTHLHKRGAFLTVKNGDDVNTMTISWGNIGFEWNRPIFTVLVRKSRYSHGILEIGKEFTVSIPYDDSLNEALSVCGSKSGRDIDKFEKCGLKLKDGETVAVPSIEGCEMVYECKVVYKQDLNPSLMDEKLLESFYGDTDYHTFYYGEITKVIKKSK